MGMNYQLAISGFDVSRAFRQLERANKAFIKGNGDSAVDHLRKGFDLLGKAFDHMAQAEEDALNKAGKQIGKGNDELEKSINYYVDGDSDRGDKHYEKAFE